MVRSFDDLEDFGEDSPAASGSHERQEIDEVPIPDRAADTRERGVGAGELDRFDRIASFFVSRRRRLACGYYRKLLLHVAVQERSLVGRCVNSSRVEHGLEAIGVGMMEAIEVFLQPFTDVIESAHDATPWRRFPCTERLLPCAVRSKNSVNRATKSAGTLFVTAVCSIR